MNKAYRDFSEMLYRIRKQQAQDADRKSHDRSKQDAITPAHVKVQKLDGHPGYDKRYHADPETMERKFSSLRPGQYLDEVTA